MIKFGGSNQVFKSVKQNGGFVGAGMRAGKGKGQRHRFDLSKMGLRAKAAQDPGAEVDAPLTDPAEEMPKMATMADSEPDMLDPNEAAEGEPEAPAKKSLPKPAGKKLNVRLGPKWMAELRAMQGRGK